MTLELRHEGERSVAYVGHEEVGCIYREHNACWHVHAYRNGRHLSSIARSRGMASTDLESLLEEIEMDGPRDD